MLPGTFLNPSDVEIGDLVQAKDPSGIWYNAHVLVAVRARSSPARRRPIGGRPASHFGLEVTSGEGLRRRDACARVG